MPEQTKRQTELDILRLLAMLAVIAMHSGGSTGVQIFGRSISNHAFVALIVWCVPVFFMISGRFFLDPARNVTLRRVLTKYVPHIVAAFVFWSAVYTVYYIRSGGYAGLNVFGILAQFIEGPYHFWYLYTLAGLYLLTPFLRKIAEDDRLLRYFLLLFGAVNLVTQYLVYLPHVGAVLQDFFDRLHLETVTGYVGYFMLGYFLWRSKERLSGRLEAAVYALGLAALFGTAVTEALIAPELQEADFVKQYMKPNVVLFSAAIFLFFLKRVSQIRFSERTARVFRTLTELGFGVYCIHALVNELLPTPGALRLVRVPCIYLVSLLAAWLLRKLPYIGKKIT